MNNTILSSKNTFSEGLIMDFAPDNTQSNCMTSALNATLLTFNGNEMSLQNDMGNGRVETARLPDGYVPVGTCEFGDIIYIVSYNPILNKSQIGCFPSPERNISSEEIGDLGQTISSSDFQELKDGNPTGKLKANSVKKVLYGNKNMNSGDKYIIYSDDLNADNTKHLSDYGNLSHRHGMFPKLVKIHVVSIEESGKIVYLDSNTKWYDNNYYISADGQKNSEGKLDIDSYRTLVSSAYSIFSSKVSGKLALLIELEKITGFSCSWEPYIESTTVNNGINYTNYLIHWNFNWTTSDNNINPNGALLLTSEWKGSSTNIGYWKKDNNKLIQEFKEFKEFKELTLPPVCTEEGPSILFTRSYLPEDCSDYKSFIENNYESNKNEKLSGIVNPYKINIDIDFETGLPNIGNYYINSVKSKHDTDMFTVQNPTLTLNKNTESDIQKIFISNSKLYPITYNEIYINEENRFNLSDIVYRGITDVCSADRYLYVLMNDSLYKFDEFNINSVNKFYQFEKIFQGIDYYNEYFYISYNGNILKVKSLDNLNDYTSIKVNFSGMLKCYKDTILIVNGSTLKQFSLEGKLLRQKDFKTEIKSIITHKNEIYVLTPDSNVEAYKITYYAKMYNNDDELLETVALNDDIVNNYFNYPVIKPFTVINNSNIENHIFKIPVSQTFDDQTLSMDISNLVYHYKFAPTMPYGYLEEYSQDGYIDFSKIGKKDITLTTWKYYNYGNTSTLTWGLDAYVEPGKGISEVVFEFYDNQGLAAAFHSKNKLSYNGKFTEYLILNDSINKHLTNVDHTGRIFRHKGKKVSSKDQMLDDRAYHYEGKWYSKNSTGDGYVYDEDDSGIIYSDCLYLVKIIVKYCNKGILGEYIESGLEYVYDYRWFWSNGLFNEYYHNTSDFNILPFKLNLDCFTHLYTAKNYEIKNYQYQSPHISDEINSDNIHESLSANIQAINIDGLSNDNIKLALTPGLANTYNTFNLNETAMDQFKVNVYLGDEYIKNIEPQPNVLYSEDNISLNTSYLQPLYDSILNKPEANPVVQLTETQDYGVSTALIVEENNNYTYRENWIRPEDEIIVEGGGGNVVNPIQKQSVDISINKTTSSDEVQCTIVANPSSTIYYTLTGAEPTTGSTEGTSFSLTKDTTVRVLAVPNNQNNFKSTYYTTIIKVNIPSQDQGQDQNKGQGKVLGDEVSKTLHTLLNTGYKTETNNNNLWDGKDYYNNYTNKFILDSTLDCEISDDNFHYQASNGEYKSINRCAKYEIEMKDILFDPDNPYEKKYFPLTLSGIHYSKYLYVIKQEPITKTLRSFVLRPGDLDNYNLALCKYNDKYIPYSTKSLAIAEADTSSDNSWACWSVNRLVATPTSNTGYTGFDYSKETLGRHAYNAGKEKQVDLHEIFQNGDLPYSHLKFIFPVHYLWDQDHSGQFYTGTNIPVSKEGQINNDKVGYSTTTESKKMEHGYRMGTLGMIKDETIEPSDDHSTNESRDIFAECGKVSLGYLSQLFYLTDDIQTGPWSPKIYAYLDKNVYSYKRDIIITINPNPVDKNFNNLILMKGIQFGDTKEGEEGYVTRILKNVFNSNWKDQKISKSPNVNLTIDKYTQTAPLEYQSEYKSPETYQSNEKIYIDSIIEGMPEYSDQHFSPGTIYGWNNDLKTFNVLGSIQKLHFITNVEYDNDRLKINLTAEGNDECFSLASVNSSRCLSVENNELVFKSIPMSNGVYYLRFWKGEKDKGDDIHDTVSGFKKFNLYEALG